MKDDVRERNPPHSIRFAVLDVDRDVTSRRHIASCPPTPHASTAAPNCATKVPKWRQCPEDGQPRSVCSVSLKKLPRGNTNISIFHHDKRIAELLISALFQKSLSFSLINLPFWSFCFFFSLCFPARRKRSSSFCSFYLAVCWLSMDSGSVAFNLTWLNLLGSRCSATAALIMLLCGWYERFRSGFRLCTYSKQQCFFSFFFFIPFCSDALSLTKGHWKSIGVRFFLGGGGAFRNANHTWHKHMSAWTLLELS